MSVPYRQVLLGETVGRAALAARRLWRCADRVAAELRRWWR